MRRISTLKLTKEYKSRLEDIMIKEGDRVRHCDPEIDSKQGIMVVFTIKNNFVVCGYGDYKRWGTGQWTYPLAELKIANQ